MNMIKNGAAAATPYPLNSPRLDLYINTPHAMPLPKYEKFIANAILEKRCGGKKNKRFSKLQSTAKRVFDFLEIKKITYGQAQRSPELLFNYAVENNLSLEYTKTLIFVLNLWGEFLAGEENQDNPPRHKQPTGYQAERIRDNFLDSGGQSTSSKPLTESQLLGIRGKISPLRYNWIFISLYFGLRPTEIDPACLRIEGDTLWVYQSKLKQLPREQRWKLMPAMLPEQKQALELIRNQSYEKPGRGMMARLFGQGYGTYAGRKGFAQLLVGRRLGLEAVSVMMGHTDIAMTRKHYINPVDIQKERMKQLVENIGSSHIAISEQQIKINRLGEKVA